VQQGDSEGLYGDDWASSRVRLRVQPLQPLTGFVVRGFRPETAPAASLKILLNGKLVADSPISGAFELPLPVTKGSEAAFDLELVSDSKPGWAKDAGDDRDLAYILTELRAQH
jgi:hypothetical protein